MSRTENWSAQRSTRPGHPFVGRRNEYQPKGGDAWRLVSIKSGMFQVWVAGRTAVWCPRYTRTISKRFTEKELRPIYKAIHKFSCLLFLLYIVLLFVIGPATCHRYRYGYSQKNGGFRSSQRSVCKEYRSTSSYTSRPGVRVISTHRAANDITPNLIDVSHSSILHAIHS